MYVERAISGGTPPEGNISTRAPRMPRCLLAWCHAAASRAPFSVPPDAATRGQLDPTQEAESFPQRQLNGERPEARAPSTEALVCESIRQRALPPPLIIALMALWRRHSPVFQRRLHAAARLHSPYSRRTCFILYRPGPS